MGGIPGRFHDGKTAATHAVFVHVNLTGMDIRDADGRALAFWHRHQLRPEIGPGPGLRLSSTAAPDARLSVDDAEAVRPFLPTADRRTPWLLGAALAVVGVLVLVGIWLALPAASTLIARAIPIDTERRWGGGLADQFERQWGTCRDVEGEAALAVLTEKLSAGLPPDQRSHRVAVVKQKDENAIALPGGRVLIFRGLLDKAQSPDEVAGVLAHEFTHVAERHAAAAMIRALGISALVTLVTGDSSGLLAGGATMMLAGAYSRDDEAAADRGAAELLGKAGLGTGGLAAFFRRVAKHDGILSDWLSSHPDSESRAKAVEAAGRPSSAAALTPRQWAALKGICGQ